MSKMNYLKKFLDIINIPPITKEMQNLKKKTKQQTNK